MRGRRSPGALPTESERRRIVSEYINDEVLVREAYARELHRRDGQVRQRLIELMRFQLQQEPPVPDEKQLRNYFAEHPDLYRTPRAVTFSQVYMSSGEGKPARDANLLLSQLRGGADFQQMGEKFWLGHRLERYDEPQLVLYFGADFASKVLALPVGEWRGPIPSTRGVQFVRVDEHDPPGVPPFETLLPTLKSDWLASARAAALGRRVEELRRSTG